MKNVASNRYTGEGGVRRTWKAVHPKKGEPYDAEVFSAYIRIGGKQCETSYSIRKHGVREAKRLATTWLDEKREVKRRLRRAFEGTLRVAEGVRYDS